MRTLEQKHLAFFTARIEFLIWTAREAVFTYDQLHKHINDVIQEKPWFESEGKPAWQHVMFRGPNPNNVEEFGPDMVDSGGTHHRYNASITMSNLPVKQLYAYRQYAHEVNQLLRAKPLGGILEIYTHLRFDEFFGPE